MTRDEAQREVMYLATQADIVRQTNELADLLIARVQALMFAVGAEGVVGGRHWH